MSDLINLIIPTKQPSGLGETVYIALNEWFATDGVKIADDGVNINENHQFANGLFGFMECQLMPRKNHLTSKSIGELAGNKFEFDLEIVIPGSYIENHSQQKQLLNKPLIVLVKDICSNESLTYQIGTQQTPAYLTHTFTTGTDKDGMKAYKINILTTGCFVQLYNGIIKIYEPPYSNYAYPLFYSSSKIANESIQDMRDAYCYCYTTSLSKIFSLIQAKTSNLVIQLEYRSNVIEKISQALGTIDTSSITNFINALMAILNQVVAHKSYEIYGSKLLIRDSDSTEQYLGLSLIEANALLAEDGDILLTEDGQILEP